MTKFFFFFTVSYDLNVITMSLIHMTLTFSSFKLFKTKFERQKKKKNLKIKYKMDGCYQLGCVLQILRRSFNNDLKATF